MTLFLESTDQEKSAETMTLFLVSKYYCDTIFNVRETFYSIYKKDKQSKVKMLILNCDFIY
jgi:hypothetical protein